MSPYHALMMQQQQAAMLVPNIGLTPVGKSPKREKPSMADQNPDCREHHSVFDVLTNCLALGGITPRRAAAVK